MCPSFRLSPATLGGSWSCTHYSAWRGVLGVLFLYFFLGGLEEFELSLFVSHLVESAAEAGYEGHEVV